MSLSLPTKLKLLSYLLRKGRRVDYLKGVLRLPPEEQRLVYIENLRRVVDETPFVRRNYPQLLSVREPEDILKLDVNWDYPTPDMFQGLEHYILTEVRTGGTTGPPKRVMVPNTIGSLKIFLDSILMVNAFVLLDREDRFFRKSFGVYERGLASDRYGKFFNKLSVKHPVWVERGSLPPERFKEEFRKALKSGADLILGEMPVLLTMVEVLRELHNEGWKPEREIYILGGGDNPAPAMSVVRELKEGGFPVRFFNLYGSTEGLFIGGSEFMGGDHPYSVGDDSLYFVYYTTMGILGRGNGDLYFVEDAPRDILSVFVTVASAFSVPNYYTGDSAVSAGETFRIVGRKLEPVLEWNPLSQCWVYYGRVVRALGMVIWDEVVDVVAQALSLSRDQLVVILREEKGKVMMYILHPDISKNEEVGEKLIPYLERSTMSYLIRDIEGGYLIPQTISVAGVRGFIDEVKRRKPNLKRFFFLEVSCSGSDVF